MSKLLSGGRAIFLVTAMKLQITANQISGKIKISKSSSGAPLTSDQIILSRPRNPVRFAPVDLPRSAFVAALRSFRPDLLPHRRCTKPWHFCHDIRNYVTRTEQFASCHCFSQDASHGIIGTGGIR